MTCPCPSTITTRSGRQPTGVACPCQRKEQPMSNLTIPSEAVEAALWAWIESAAEGVIRENVSPRVLDRNRPRAVAALSAAMPLLHPTIPNTVEGLDALPDEAVIRGMSDDGAVVAEKWRGTWLATGESESYDSRDLARVWQDIATWTVLWPLGGAA